MRNGDTSGPSARLFAQDLLNALRLKRLLQIRSEDTKRPDSDTKIIYAFDSEIIADYFYPLIDRTRSGHSDLQLFSGEEEDAETQCMLDALSRRLSATIARFVVDRLDTDHGGIILPGHAAEVRGIYDQIIKCLRGYSETVKNVETAINKLIAKLKAEMDSEKESEELPVFYSDLLWDRLNAFESPLFASNRFLDLLYDHHFATLTAARSEGKFDHIFNKDVPHPFRHREHIEDFVDDRFATLIGYNDTIALGSNDSLSPEEVQSRQNDALALLRLFQINRELEPLKCKMILVTPNARIGKMAERISTFPDNLNFAEKYIRHPYAFLTDCLTTISNTDPLHQDNPEFVGIAWLDALLSPFDNELDPSDVCLYSSFDDTPAAPILIQYAFNALQEDPSAHKSFSDRWVRFLSNATELGLASDPNTFETLTILTKAVEGDIEAPLSEFRSIIQQRTEYAWQNFFETAANAAIDLFGTSFSSADYIKCSLPPSIFTHHKTAQSVTISLKNGLDPKKARSELLHEFNSLDADDRTGYTRTLAYSLLFAYSDRWQLADLLAQRAIRIYRSEKERTAKGSLECKFALTGDGRISGREAYYLSAAFSRVLAETEEDFDRVTNLLDQAEDALSRETAYENESKQHIKYASSLSGIRFRVERNSLTLSQLLHERYAADTLDQDKVLEACKEIEDDARSQLSSASDISDAWLADRLKLTLYTNIFLARLASENKGPPTSAEIKLGTAPLREDVLSAYSLLGGRAGWYSSSGKQEIADDAFSAASRLDRVACIYAMTKHATDDIGYRLPTLHKLERELRHVRFLVRTHPALILTSSYDDALYEDLLDSSFEAMRLILQAS